MKVKILKPTGSQAGFHTGITKDFQFGEVVEAVWMCSKKNSVLINGSEFVRLGGLPENFPHLDKGHIWGCYEVVEE